jgi:C4-dicarboxylate-specific signal transduction histidine kinase
VTLSVHDMGRGITEELLTHIFEQFCDYTAPRGESGTPAKI